MKLQVITTLEKAEKSTEFETKISYLEAQVSSLSSKIIDLTYSEQYMICLVEE
jgi:hypothetical protein